MPMDRESTPSDILSPRSVAVVGVSTDPTKIGSRIYANIVAGGFVGAVYPVNSAGIVIGGKPSYRSLIEIPAPVDLVIVAVPAAAAESVVLDAIHRNARAVVVISSGFAEMGEVGRAVEARLVASARAGGARLIGPNCFGVINGDPAVRLHATFGQMTGNGGSVAFASQSGAVGILFLERARSYGLGVRAFVSLGNSADVSAHELIELWGNDPAIDVIAVYLESVTAGAELVRISREVSKRKPIFALTAGRTNVGKKAASSHSAALASATEGIDAVLQSGGIVRVERMEELLEATYLATRGVIPRGPQVGVITNSGGPGILFTDRAVSRGLDVPPLSAQAQSILRADVSNEASLFNPIDLTAAASPADVKAAINILSCEIDIVVVIVVDIGLTPVERFVEAVENIVAQKRCRVPIVLVLPSGTEGVRVKPETASIISILDTVAGGADAIADVVRATSFKERVSVPSPFDEEAVTRLRALAQQWCENDSERWLCWSEIEQLLGVAGIPCVRGWEGPLDSFADGAVTIGYPLVAKLVTPGVLHKSDVGGVVTDIQDTNVLAATIARFREIAAEYASGASLILQPYIKGGREGFVGVSVDPHLGPLIGCGWGGVLVEALRDITLASPPISTVDARRMVDRLRFRRLLEPFRGAPPHDRRFFEDIIVRLGVLTTILPEIEECDLNPVRIFPEGEGCLVLDARIRIRS